MSRAAIFIDGAYLGFVLREFGAPRIDHALLAERMADGVEILRTYYYDCPPYQSASPSPDERDRFAKSQRFFTALDRLPRFEVRLGRLALRGIDSAGQPIFQQKRVDIMLAGHLALLSGRSQITHAILLAGDSDFIPAVVAAKSQGVLVRLYHGRGAHKDLWDCVDERVQISRSLIDSILRN